MLFFFNDTATTEIYTLSLHDALPISLFLLQTVSLGVWPVSAWAPSMTILMPLLYLSKKFSASAGMTPLPAMGALLYRSVDRKSTRLNSSHANISYAVFCLKKKNTTYT